MAEGSELENTGGNWANLSAPGPGVAILDLCGSVTLPFLGSFIWAFRNLEVAGNSRLYG